jgi:predicted nucleic acid-binding protein
MGQNDLWVSATASAADAHLITTDRDFDHLDQKFIKLVRIDPTTGATL